MFPCDMVIVANVSPCHKSCLLICGKAFYLGKSCNPTCKSQVIPYFGCESG